MTRLLKDPLPPQVRANQMRAADPGASVWVAANAGSGKTHVLTQRVLRLLLSGVSPDSILCLTYTKAAAAVMRDRVARDLGRWAVMDEASLVAALTALCDAAPEEARLQALAAAVARLEQDFGSWGVAWGDVNRFQRNDAAIDQVFDDAKPSSPVPFVSSRWGSLASFGAHRWPGTKRYYGTSGNSFVAVVEFGDRVRARAVTAGGESGDPASPHFRDEVERYAQGNLREVYFWPDQRKGHVERSYRPGE